MVKTFDLHFICPNVRLQEDEVIVHQTLEAAPGVGLVEVDYKTGRVRVITANQDGGLDVRQRLDGAGYPVAEEEIPAVRATEGSRPIPPTLL